MAQFDVHRNTGRLRDTIPFVVVVQSSQFDAYRRRVVVPLVRAKAFEGPLLRSLNPEFTIRNVRVLLQPLDMVSVPAEALGEHVASLADSGDTIVAAVDEVLTRAWN